MARKPKAAKNESDAPETKRVFGDVDVSRGADGDPEFTDAPAAKPVPRFNAEGVLLNPEECHVGPDGVVRAK